MRLANRNNVLEVASTLFLWHNRRKEKALQKESAVRESFAACGRRPKATRLGCAPPFEKGGRKLSKQAWGDSPPTFLLALSPGEVFTLR